MRRAHEQPWRTVAPGRVSWWLANLRESWSRAVSHPGYERDAVLQALKSMIACTLAWFIAEYVLHEPAATFAPFSALLVVQVTVYRSLSTSARYASAVTLGIVIAGGAGIFLGSSLWSFVLMLAVAMLVSRLPFFGSQYVQLPVAAVFAFGGQYAMRAGTLGSLLTAALLGAGIGVLVNLALAPPMRSRHAAATIRDLSASVCELLVSMGSGLREGGVAQGAPEWLHRSQRCATTAANARLDVQHGQESIRWNPQRLLRPTPSLEGYRIAAQAMGRAVDQIQAIAGSLAQEAEQDPESQLSGEFLDSYGRLLHAAADIAGLFGQREDDASLDEPRRFVTRLNESRQLVGELSRKAEMYDLSTPGGWPVHETLLLDAQRLVEEFGRHHPGAAVPTVHSR